MAGTWQVDASKNGTVLDTNAKLVSITMTVPPTGAGARGWAPNGLPGAGSSYLCLVDNGSNALAPSGAVVTPPILFSCEIASTPFYSSPPGTILANGRATFSSLLVQNSPPGAQFSVVTA
jgi:hypothetical protein